jgi:hypothetical protein
MTVAGGESGPVLHHRHSGGGVGGAAQDPRTNAARHDPRSSSLRAPQRPARLVGGPTEEASAVSAQPDDVQRLRDLHDFYVWELNAAIGEGREDLAWELADDYVDSAMRAMTAAHPIACERDDCVMCTRPRATRPRRGWLSRLLR